MNVKSEANPFTKVMAITAVANSLNLAPSQVKINHVARKEGITYTVQYELKENSTGKKHKHGTVN